MTESCACSAAWGAFGFEKMIVFGAFCFPFFHFSFPLSSFTDKPHRIALFSPTVGVTAFLSLAGGVALQLVRRKRKAATAQ